MKVTVKCIECGKETVAIVDYKDLINKINNCKGMVIGWETTLQCECGGTMYDSYKVYQMQREKELFNMLKERFGGLPAGIEFTGANI